MKTHRIYYAGSLRIGGTLLILTTLLLAGCTEDTPAVSENRSEEYVPVQVTSIEKSSTPQPIHSSGRLSAKAEVRLSFKIGGIIDRIYADEGQQVRAGRRLAQLNMAEIEAQVLQAQSGFDKAQRDLDRVQSLLADSVATREQGQDAETALKIAEANLEIAAFNRAHAEIIAPSNGRILKRLAEENELVQAGMPLFLFASDQGGWVVRVGLSDRDIVQVSLGDSTHLQFDAYPGVLFRGLVSEIADAADPLSGTFEVEVQVEDPGQLLKSGFIARVDIYPNRENAFYFLPVEALVEGDGKEGTIYILSDTDSLAQRRQITIEHMFDDRLAILAGDLENATVVTRGASFLKEGDRVRVVPDTP